MNPDEDPSKAFTPRKSLDRSPIKSTTSHHAPPVDLSDRRPVPKIYSKEDTPNQDRQTKTRHSSKLTTSKALNTSIEGSGSEEDDDAEDLDPNSDLNETTLSEVIETNSIFEQLSTLVKTVTKQRKSLTTKQENALSELSEKAHKAYLLLQSKHSELKGAYKELTKTFRQTMHAQSQVDLEIAKGVAKEAQVVFAKISEKVHEIQLTTCNMHTHAAATVNSDMQSFAKVTSKGLKTTTRNNKKLQTMLIYPKDNKEQTSEETKHAIKKVLNPIALGLKIERINKVRNGGVAIEMDTIHFANS